MTLVKGMETVPTAAVSKITAAVEPMADLVRSRVTAIVDGKWWPQSK